jgi:PAS domain S-box-containing protein
VSADEGTATRPRDALDRVRRVLHTLVVSRGTADGAELVLAQAVAGVGASGAALLHLPSGGGVEVLATAGVADDLVPCPDARLLPPGTPAGHAAALREPVWVTSRSEREERFPALPRPAGRDGACAALPLVCGRDLVGLLVLGWDADHRAGTDEVAFLAAVADLAALAVRAARSPDATGAAGRAARVPNPAHPVEATRPVDRTPSGGIEDLLRALFTEAPIGFALFDRDLRFVMVNEALAAVNGLPVEAHLGRFVRDVLPDIDDAAEEVLRRVLLTGEPLRDVEISGRTPASAQRRTWLEDFYRLRTPSGEVLGVAAVLSDVTAQRRSERRLRQVIDSLFSFVGLCLPDGTLVEVNRTALRGGGLTMADVIGHKVWQTPWVTWDPAVAERVRASVERARAGESSRFDLEVRMAHGNVIVDYQMVPVVEDGETVALVPSATDVTARRRSVEQATGLAHLARRLNAVSTVAEVADVIRRHASAAAGSRYAAVGLLDGDGATVSLLQPPDLPAHLHARYRTLPLGSPLHIVRAIRDSRTVVVADPVCPQDVDGDAELARRLREDRAEAGVGVTVATPLVGGDGVTFGAVSMGWPEAADLDDELAARVETIAELCAQSVERARLADARVVAAQRTAALAALAQGLASAVTTSEVTAAITRLTPGVVGARVASVELVGEQPARDGVGTPPALETLVRAASATLPLRDSAGRVIGRLTLGWRVPVRFEAVLRATLATVAELCGQTVERARLHAAEHELVEGLQRRFLRPLPDVAGTEIHATYLAAQRVVGIGGDFYDGVLLPDGRIAVVVCDVAGHGMEAAADMAQLRTVLSTLLAAGAPLGTLFVRAEQVLGQVADVSLATAAVAVVDLGADVVTYLHAGHPPFVLRSPDGVTRTLDGARGPLLGVSTLGGAGRQGVPATVPFAPGSILVGYTDGLVETRRTPLGAGIDALVEAVAQVGGPAGPPTAADVAAAVLERCVADRPLTDDVALLVLSRPAR